MCDTCRPASSVLIPQHQPCRFPAGVCREEVWESNPSACPGSEKCPFVVYPRPGSSSSSALAILSCFLLLI